jgi:hypothetical protein
VISAPGSPRSWHASLHDRPADPMTLSSPTVPRCVTTTKRRSPQPNAATRLPAPNRDLTNRSQGKSAPCHLGLGIRPASGTPYGHFACVLLSSRRPRRAGVPHDPPDEMPGEGAITATESHARVHARASASEPDACAPATDEQRASRHHNGSRPLRPRRCGDRRGACRTCEKGTLGS